MNNELPVVLIKRKHIQTIFDYCMDNKVEFTVREKPFTVEEFEVTLQITEIKKAIAFGIFARENKIEVVGVNDQAQNQTKNSRKATATPAPAAPTPVKTNEPEANMFDTEEKEEVEEQETVEMEAEEKKPENKPFSLDLSSSSLSFS
jgi:hypothetical protein